MESQVWKELEVGVNAVCERIHLPWLPTVIEHKILPCTTLTLEIKITATALVCCKKRAGGPEGMLEVRGPCNSSSSVK